MATPLMEGEGFSLFAPPGQKGLPCLFWLAGEDSVPEAGALYEELSGPDCPFVLVLVASENWNRDFSPWPADGLHPGDAPFAGGAPEFFDRLLHTLLPQLDGTGILSRRREDRALMGYSLAGLAALYALFYTDCFSSVAGLSSSLWYDGVLPYFREHALCAPDTRVYLSLGAREQKTRNPRMAAVGDNTRECVRILREKLVSPGLCVFESMPGGHFTQIPTRLELAARWLLGMRHAPVPPGEF